jgi:hypothetical protein
MAKRRLVALCSFFGFVLVTSAFTGCGSSDEETNTNKDAGNDSSQGGSGGAGAQAGSTATGGSNTGGGNTGGGNTGGSSTGGGGPCSAASAACATNADCCSANCDPTAHVCTNPTSCKPAGGACTVATDCCGLVCNGGTCGSLCTSDGQACTANAECCGGSCANSVCAPLNPGCKTAGNACSNNGDCCSKQCKNGNCALQVSFCTQTGDACAADAECCGGICHKQPAATLGTCTEPKAPGTTGCLIAGQVCGAGATSDGGVPLTDAGIPVCGGECCSRSCAPYGPTGVLVCQPPSGCHPTGEVCVVDTDCCGAPGVPGGNGSVKCSKDPGAPVGRCDNGQSCRPAGAVCKLASTSCNAENNCCAGNVNQDPNVCQQDLLGIPRCTGVGDCADAGSLAGQPCATSADCCGLPCLPNADPNGAPFICGTSCVQTGGACTTDADCCAGLPCKAPPGSTQGVCGDNNIPDGGTGGSGGTAGTGGAGGTAGSAGTGGGCAYYGQNCTTAADCCNGVPCTVSTNGGHCVYPIN